MVLKPDVLQNEQLTAVLDDTTYDHTKLVILEKMVEDGDIEPSIFVEAVQSIDWAKKSADFYNAALRLVFNAGAYQFARELSARALTQYPDNERLKRWATVLAPPKVVGTRPADPSIGDTMRWLKANGHQYRGVWLAVKGGELLDCDKKRENLIERLGEQAENADVLITWNP